MTSECPQRRAAFGGRSAARTTTRTPSSREEHDHRPIGGAEPRSASEGPENQERKPPKTAGWEQDEHEACEAEERQERCVDVRNGRKGGHEHEDARHGREAGLEGMPR